MSTAQSTPLKTGSAYLLVLALFLLSGFSSLIYQVVWTRLLVLVFGSTTYATSTVLAVFMGGLALGSFVAGRIADRIKRPLIWYGVLEGVIGLWALLVPVLFQQALTYYRQIGELYHLDFATFSAVRLVEAAAILIIPTTCMGATLPLLARFVTDSLEKVGRRVGTIYAINTLGAVLGTAAAGFVLLPWIGMAATTNVAAVINLLLFGAVMALSPFLETSGAVDGTDTTLDAAKNRLSGKIVAVLFAIAVSGAAAMVYEVCWTRTLAMVIGSSTYAFSIMLATFLTGIFLGSLIWAWIADRIEKPIAWFGIFQLLICFACLLSMHLLPYLPWLNLLLNNELPQDSFASLRVRLVLSACILLPLAACLGAIFPLVIRACATELKSLGRSVGTIYSFNTIGAIGGAVLAGFALIPWLGVEKTLLASCAVNLLVGVLLLSIDAGMNKKRVYALMAIGCVAAAACVCVPHLWDRTVLLEGQDCRRALRTGMKVFPTPDDWRNSLCNRSVVFYKDGPCSTVGVLHTPDSQHGTTWSLFTNGCVDASDGLDMVQQVTLGAYPMLWRPDAKDVCVIGWGSGVTTGELLQFPVRSLTAVELEPAVMQASYYFRLVNYQPERDKRVQIEVNDGRNYLLTTNKKFDLIVSEPSNPWQVGVCNLFTKEYFAICHDRLNPGGTLTLWMQLSEVSPSMTRCILASLKNQFKYCLAIATDQSNIVVLASDSPLKAPWKSIRDSYYSNTAVQHDLTRQLIGSPEAVLARIVTTSENLDGIIRGAPLNSDDLNYLEFVIGETYENKTYSAVNALMFEKAIGVNSLDVDWGDLSREQKGEVMHHVALEALEFERPFLAYAWALNSASEDPNEAVQKLLEFLKASNQPAAPEATSRPETGTANPRASN